jgi:hypothetical protein
MQEVTVLLPETIVWTASPEPHTELAASGDTLGDTVSPNLMRLDATRCPSIRSRKLPVLNRLCRDVHLGAGLYEMWKYRT